MQATAATTRSARVPAAEPAVPLRDIEDLHDADLDLVLADRLAESAVALRVAGAAAELRVAGAAAELARELGTPAALAAHALGPGAHRLTC